jgi:hypothetical protein
MLLKPCRDLKFANLNLMYVLDFCELHKEYYSIQARYFQATHLFMLSFEFSSGRIHFGVCLYEKTPIEIILKHKCMCITLNYCLN